MDSAKDGWRGNELVVTNDETKEITPAHIGSTFNTCETQIETHCVEGCGCWTAKEGGGSYTNEVGWSLQWVGADEFIAKGGLNIKEEEGARTFKKAALSFGRAEQAFSSRRGRIPTDGILKALTFTCTSLVEKCVIDALAHFGDPRVVLRMKHGGEIYSSFVGLVVRGGYVSGGYGIGMYVEDGSRVNLSYCEIVSNKGYSGGGLYANNSDDNSGGYCIVNIRATVFANNTATNLGADIYAYKGNILLYPVATKKNIYSSSATIKFQGSDCEAGEEGTTNPNYAPTFEGDPAYLEGGPSSYTGCRDCEPGRYSDAPYAELCSQCDAGTYTDQFKTTACSGCKMGTYMSSLGTAACANCDSSK